MDNREHGIILLLSPHLQVDPHNLECDRWSQLSQNHSTTCAVLGQHVMSMQHQMHIKQVTLAWLSSAFIARKAHRGNEICLNARVTQLLGFTGLRARMWNVSATNCTPQSASRQVLHRRKGTRWAFISISCFHSEGSYSCQKGADAWTRDCGRERSRERSDIQGRFDPHRWLIRPSLGKSLRM